MTSPQKQPTMATVFVPDRRVLPVAIYPRGHLMKSFRLLGLALGASFAFSASAFAQDITIAVAGPLTGGESAFGRQMKNGADQAVADINAAGGVLGKKLALDAEDDACDPKTGALGGGKDRRRENPVRGRAFLLFILDPGVGSLCRWQRAADHPGLDQSAVHGAQALERGPCLRP